MSGMEQIDPNVIRRADERFQAMVLYGASIDGELPLKPQIGFLFMQSGLLDLETPSHSSELAVDDQRWRELLGGDDSVTQPTPAL